jgi:hypothetical protein
MNRMRVRLWLLVMLVLLVGPGLVHARPATDGRAAVKAAEPSALVQAWDWLVSMFGNGGSFIDPNGVIPQSLANGTHTDGGSFIDPNGEH